jgi:serpin B
VLEIRLPEKALSRREITAWLALPAPVASTDRMVHLGFPKTELRSSISWIDSLRAIGAKELLLEANLANATQERGLRLSELATETSLRFDEEGAKIASSAAAVVSARGIPSEEIQLILDRPFAWAIREVETGIPLAAGIMERPTLPQPARPAAATANDSPVK